MAEVVNRSLTDAEKNEYAIRAGGSTVEDLLARPMFADPLRKHDCAPVTDGAAAIVLAAGDRALEVRDRPAWITGVSTLSRRRSHLNTRDLTRSQSAANAAAAIGGLDGVEIAELHAPFSHQELILRAELGLAGDVRLNPSGGALAGNPMFTGGAIRIGEAARRIWDGTADKVLGARHPRSRAAAEPRVRDGSQRRAEQLMAKVPAAVIGVGQTHHRAKREDVSMAGLFREAIDRALEDAGMTLDDIDAVVVGKAPDLFEGVMMPELYLADALGAAGKPLLRVHTAGSVGGSTAIVAASLVQAGVHERVLTVAFEKQSESNAMWALSVPVPFIMPVHAGAGGYFAPHVRSYIRRSGAPDPHRRDGRGQGPAATRSRTPTRT